jgi:predicted enzyme related to lactoylglutathione lyase
MLDPNFIILYVHDALSSATFYSALLEKEPIETSPAFAMFALDSGLKFGLWSKHTIEPAATPVGGAEIAFPLGSKDQVDEICKDWTGQGMEIAQNPTQMDFGYTFVALDPDGHRLRVFAPSEM